MNTINSFNLVYKVKKLKLRKAVRWIVLSGIDLNKYVNSLHFHNRNMNNLYSGPLDNGIFEISNIVDFAKISL